MYYINYWLPWKARFVREVHDNQSLGKDEKYEYLLSALEQSSSAYSLVFSFAAGVNNYDSAWKALLKRYDNPDTLKHFHLKAIMDLSAVMCDGKQIRDNDIFYASASSGAADVAVSEEKTMKEYVQEIIKHFLKKHDNNVVKVAEKLDIGKSTIYKMNQNKEIVLN